MSRYSYVSIIQNLVSLGFVVVSIDSPNSGLMLLPNGEMISTLYEVDPVIHSESMAKDVSFVYDYIKDSKDKRLREISRYVDLKKAGVVGHSLGGAAAFESCRIDDRFSACINLDGDPFGVVETVGLNKPSLIILNEPTFPPERFSKPGSKERWDSMGNIRKKTWQNLFAKSKHVPVSAIRIMGTNHMSFTDFPFIALQYYRNRNAGIIINRERGLTIITSYIKAFFDRYLLNNGSVDMNKLSGLFPECNIYLTTEKKND